jgi:hypothetical protein
MLDVLTALALGAGLSSAASAVTAWIADRRRQKEMQSSLAQRTELDAEKVRRLLRDLHKLQEQISTAEASLSEDLQRQGLRDQGSSGRP